MLKLFYSPGACSLVSHIALEESGAEFEAVRVVLLEREHVKPEYLAINPRARVPALATDDGVITENIAILNYVADRFGMDGSVPRGDAFATAKCNEVLGWFASTVHIGFAGVWRAERFTSDLNVYPAIQSGGREVVKRSFDEIEDLCGSGWFVAGRFTAADSYLLTFFRWGKRIELDMSPYSKWAALVERVLARPAVARTIEREGLELAQFRP